MWCTVHAQSLPLVGILKPRAAPSSRLVRASASNGSKGAFGEAWSQIEREVRKNVDANPGPAPKPLYGKDPVGDNISKNEQFALNGWTSSKLQVTGAAVALAMAMVLVVQGPPSSM